jgi:hypothetical protein
MTENRHNDALVNALSKEERCRCVPGVVNSHLADTCRAEQCAEPGLTRLNLMGTHEAYASPAQQRIANLMPLGGLAQVGSTGRLGVAAFIPGDQPSPYDITARGYGPSGPGLAKYLARQAIVWHELGRPGAQDLELSAWPPGARPETSEARASSSTGPMSASPCDGRRCDGAN